MSTKKLAALPAQPLVPAGLAQPNARFAPAGGGNAPLSELGLAALAPAPLVRAVVEPALAARGHVHFALSAVKHIMCSLLARANVAC